MPLAFLAWNLSGVASTESSCFREIDVTLDSLRSIQCSHWLPTAARIADQRWIDDPDFEPHAAEIS